jgi:arginyl-tRNA synthetase
LTSYPLPQLKLQISEAISKACGGPLSVIIYPVNRDRFHADLTVKIPELMKLHGPKAFHDDISPKIKAALEGSDACMHAIDDIKLVGQFVNIRLKDTFILNSLASVHDLGAQFGKVNTEYGQKIVVDYSSPNAAKELHAGHIRSTIIGHVLANLHEACGATVYRVNHINDLGGFGYLIEGYRRWGQSFPAGTPPHRMLIDLYGLRRALETANQHAGTFAELPQREKEIIDRFIKPKDMEAVRTCFVEFSKASDLAAEKLENGDRAVVTTWQEMVQWSLNDFEQFYSALNIHLDFTLGESFYLQEARQLIHQGIAKGALMVWTPQKAAEERNMLDERLVRAEITPNEHKIASESIQRDIGATVIPLESGERLVVLRADGRSIYATRDLAAISLRHRLFDSSKIIYVAGQEQREHFNNVFESAYKLGSIPPEVKLKHIYFGFYVDAESRKKLSSRAGAANVHQLLDESRRYFAYKFDAKAGGDQQSRGSTSQALAVGSVVFNDLRKDLKSSIEINATSLTKTIEEFEKAGGAYVIYSACRARSIVEKYGKPVPEPSAITSVALTSSEASLVTLIQELPEKIAEAAREDNPVTLVRHLTQLASDFNTFYNSHPVIKDGKAHEHRVIICAAVHRALENGLRLCHVDCPSRI